MPTLAPRQTFDVAIEQPVQQPSTLKALSGLVDAGTKLVGQALESQDPNLEQALVNGLDQAQQLRAQGDMQAALQMERNVLINYGVAGGDPNSGQAQSIIRTYTGRDPESVGFSQEEMLSMEISDPDSELGKAYNGALLAAQGMRPDGSDEDQHQLAMSLIVQQQANDLLVEEAQYNWNNASRGAMLDRVRNFGNLALGNIGQIAKQGGTIALEDIQATRSAFMQFRAELEAKRPANLPQEEWADIEAALDARKAQIEYFEELAAPGNLDARATASFMRAIEESGIPDPDANIAIRLLSDNPGLLLERGIQNNTDFNQSMSTVMKYMDASENELDTGQVRDPSVWDDTSMIGPDAEPLSVGEAQKYSRAATTTMGIVPSAQLANNAELRDNWGRAAVRGMSAFMNVGEQGRYMSTKDINRFFSPKFFNDLEAIRSTDPGLYNNIVSKASRVLAVQRNVVGQKFSVIGQDSPFEFNVNTGAFRLNRQRAEEVLKPGQFKALDRAITELYEGDWDAIVQDNGARLYQADFRDPAITVWQSIGGTRNGVPQQLQEIGRSYHAINSALRKTEQFEPAAVNTGGNVNTGASDFGTLGKFIDQTESGGDYNALLGFTNRPGKPFAGVQVTSMTIGELKEFTSRSGQYGQWTMNWKRENNHGNPNIPSTPLGRYQFVGTTMASVAKEMGLPDSTVFTPEVQDAMFHFHVNELIQGQSDTQAARTLKGTWEGFKNYTDAEMQAAVAEFRGTPMPALTITTSDSASGTTTEPAAGTTEVETTPDIEQETLQTAPPAATPTPPGDPETTTAQTPQPERRRIEEQNAADQRAMVIQRLMDRGASDERIAEILETMGLTEEE